jgi:hypothetical protein
MPVWEIILPAAASKKCNAVTIAIVINVVKTSSKVLKNKFKQNIPCIFSLSFAEKATTTEISESLLVRINQYTF